MKLLASTAVANINHRHTPSQINLKPHAKKLLASAAITKIHYVQLKQKFTRHSKRQKKKKNLKRKGNHQNHIHIGIYFENVGQEMFDNYN